MGHVRRRRQHVLVKLLADEIVERRRRPMSRRDPFGRVALRFPLLLEHASPNSSRDPAAEILS